MPLAARPPFRADHVGSLLRPPKLKALRLEKESGRASEGELRAAEDAAIREVVALQEAAGLQGITDGELRRKSWHMDFLLQLGGLSSQGQTIPVTFHGQAGDVHFTRPDLAITSRVTRPRPIFVEAFKFLASVELERLHEDRRSEEHTSELQSQSNIVCRLLLEKKKGERTRRGGY